MTALARTLSIVSLLVLTSTRLFAADVAVQLTGTPHAPIGATEYVHIGLTTAQGQNAGTALTYAMPPGVTFNRVITDWGSSFTCTTPPAGGTGTIACIGAFITFEDIMIQLDVSPTLAPDTVLNHTVHLTVADDNGTNDSSTVTQTAAVLPLLDVTTTYPETFVAGLPFSYDVTLHNIGQVAADDIAFSQFLTHGGIGKISSMTGPCSATLPANVISCSIPTLAAGATTSFHFSVLTSPNLASGGGLELTTKAIVLASYAYSLDQTTYGTRSSDVQVTSSAPASVNVGDDFNYTAIISTNGPGTSSAIKFTFATPLGTTFKSIASPPDATPYCAAPAVGSAGTIVCDNLASLKVTSSFTTASTRTFVITLHAAAAATAAGTAAVTATDDPVAANNSCTATTQIGGTQADVSIALTADPATDASGSAGVTVSLHNNGPATATNIVAMVTAAGTFTQLPSGCTASGSAVTCSVASLASGATSAFPFHITFSGSGPNPIHGTVTAEGTDPNAANNAADASTVVVSTVDLVLTGYATPTSILAGGTVTLEAVLTNAGNSTAGNALVTVSLPPGVTQLNSSIGCAQSGTNIPCTLGSLASHQTVSYGMNLRAPQTTGPFTVTMTASTTANDVDPSNNTKQVTVTVPGNTATPALSIAAEPGTISVVPAQYFTFTLRARNDGPAAADNVVITDMLPLGVTLVSAQPSSGSCSGSAPLTCQVGTLSAGGSAIVTIGAFAPLSASGTNAASVTSGPWTASTQNSLVMLPTSRHRAARH